LLSNSRKRSSILAQRRDLDAVHGVQFHAQPASCLRRELVRRLAATGDLVWVCATTSSTCERSFEITPLY